MLSWMQGLVIDKALPTVTVNVNGLGYELQVPVTTFCQLPEIGESVTLHVQTVWREEGPAFYGFHQPQQRQFFRQLIKVNGVGPKVALALLAEDYARLAEAFQSRSVTLLTKVPGVGKKTAERLIVELADKLEPIASHAPVASMPLQKEAIAALEALGYKTAQATKAVSAIDVTQSQDVGEVVKDALRGMNV